MGRRLDIYLWTLMVVSFGFAMAGHGTWVGTAGLAGAIGALALWVLLQILSAVPYWRMAAANRERPRPDIAGILDRLRAARAGGNALTAADREALAQRAASAGLDDVAQQEILDSLAGDASPARADDVEIAIELLRSNSRALGVLLAALPGFESGPAQRVARAIMRDLGHLVRAKPILLDDTRLLAPFGRALADAFTEDSRFTAAVADPELARALEEALAGDPARRRIIEARWRAPGPPMTPA